MFGCFALGTQPFGGLSLTQTPFLGEVVLLSPSVSKGGGGQQRTYLFVPQNVVFNIGFRGTVHESHFEIPQNLGKVSAKKVDFLIKAKKDGNN